MRRLAAASHEPRAEAALVRVVHHYGNRPEFVVLGGLVPELWCSASAYAHAGTTDVDVQVDLEIAAGSVHTTRLETALRNAEFKPDSERVWRWIAEGLGANVVIRFELLADLDDQPEGAVVIFDECEDLGAANLRGTGYAARDIEVRQVSSRIGGVVHTVEVNVAGLAGYLLAKIAAAYSRRKPKDWYDISFVLLHNDAGGILIPMGIGSSVACGRSTPRALSLTSSGGGSPRPSWIGRWAASPSQGARDFRSAHVMGSRP